MSSRHGLSLRAADAADVDGLAELLRTAGAVVSRERLALQVAAVQAQPGALLVAQEWGPPTGVIAVHWTARLTLDLKVAEISYLLVDPDRRRSGVARLLLKAASQAARAAGCGELLLGATADRDDVNAFAVATGFIPVGGVLARSLRKRA